MTEKRPTRFYIVDDFAAGDFAGREGVSMGWSTRLDDLGPVVGARKGRDEEVAVSIYFEDTDEQVWFAQYLVKKIES
jgi:hypothetical protein